MFYHNCVHLSSITTLLVSRHCLHCFLSIPFCWQHKHLVCVNRALQPIDRDSIHYLEAHSCLHVLRETRYKPQLPYTMITPALLLGDYAIQCVQTFLKSRYYWLPRQSLARGLIRQLVNERQKHDCLSSRVNFSTPLLPPLSIPSGDYSIMVAMKCSAFLWC